MPHRSTSGRTRVIQEAEEWGNWVRACLLQGSGERGRKILGEDVPCWEDHETNTAFVVAGFII